MSLIERIEQNLNILSSFEAFSYATKFPSILCLQFSNTTVKNDFYSQFMNVNQKQNIHSLIKALDNFSNVIDSKLNNNVNIYDDYNLKNTINPHPISEYMFSSNGFFNSLTTHFEAITLPLPLPESDTEQLPSYFNFYVDIFKNLFKSILKYIRDNTSESTGNEFFNPLTESIVVTSLDGILHYIETHIDICIRGDVGDEPPNMNAFLGNVYDKMMKYRMSSETFDFKQSHYNLFFIVFIPYFFFLYIKNIIPSKIIATNSKSAVRDGIIHRQAILALYKLYVYTLYGSYKVCALYDPTSVYSLQMRLILDTNMTALFDKEININSTKNFLLDLNKETKKNLNNLSSLQDNNKKIATNRSNINNILNYQTQTDKDLKKTLTIKYVVLSFFLLYLIICIVAYFWLRKHVEYMYIASLIIAFILLIIGMIAIVKNFS